MKHIISILFIVFCLLSCSEKKEDTAIIDLDAPEKVSISDIFESADVVQLETNDDCLISSISKVVFWNDRYHILDLKLQTVFCFDSNGRFLFKIFRKGQGPEEYTYLEEFNIDPYNNQLLLLEPFGGLLLFDLEGTFISKIKLPREIVAYNEVFPLDRERLLFISLNKYQLVFYDRPSNTIIEKRYDMGSARGNVFSPLFKTYTYNGNVFFSPPPTNDIINLSDNSIFSWNFGKKNNSSEKIDKLRKLFQSEGETPDRDYVGEGKLDYAVMYNYETSRYRICLLDCGHIELKHVFFDKKTKKAFVFDKTIENMRFILPDFSGESLTLYDRGFDPEFFMPFYSEDYLTEEQKNVIKLNNPEIDNPFLVKYNFKK